MNEQLEKIAKFFNTDKVVSNEEMQQAIDAIAQVLLTFKEATTQVNQDTQRQLGELMSKVEEAYQKNVGEVSMAQLEQAIAYVRSKVDEVMAMRPRDGRDGVDGRDGKNGKDGRDGRDGKSGSPDTAEQIKGKLETLKGDARLDASAIKNLPEATQTVVREMTLGQVETPLKAGTGITITKDATGAKVISSTGGGTGDVTKVGTPVDNQVGVWTGDGTLEGDTALTFDTTTDTLTSGVLNATSLTASEIVGTDGSKNLVSLAVATYPSLTELSYVKGVTSAIQTQLNAKLTSSSISDTAYGVGWNGDTTVAPSKNAVYDEMENRAPKASPTFTGTVTLPVGLTGVLRADSGVVSTDSDVTDLVSAASDTTAGKVELAIASEVNTGTDATRAISPDAFAGSNFGIRYYPIALNGSTALTTSDKFYFRIPAGLNGMNLVSVTGSVGTGASGASSSGTPTFTVKNVTDNNQMLSTSLTIDANEYTSATAATPAVIDTTKDDVVTDDLIEVACTVAGTGTTYAVVTLGFALP